MKTIDVFYHLKIINTDVTCKVYGFPLILIGITGSLCIYIHNKYLVIYSVNDDVNVIGH